MSDVAVRLGALAAGDDSTRDLALDVIAAIFEERRGVVDESDRTATGRALEAVLRAETDQVRCEVRLALSAEFAKERERERFDVLGLVVEMLQESGTGALIPEQDYEAERRLRVERGEKWLSSTALARRFGVDREGSARWRTVVLRAAGLWLRAPGSKAGGERRHIYESRPRYVLVDALRALAECRAACGFWPTRWEYEAWSAWQRRLLRERGQVPLLPAPRVFDRLARDWGWSWDEIDAAARAWSERGELPDDAHTR